MPASLPIARLEATALPGMPLVRPGDDLVQLIRDALARAGLALAAGDVLVLAQVECHQRYAWPAVETSPRAA